MLKFVRAVVFGLLFCAVPAAQSFAQLHPMPGSKSEPAVICTGCPSTNSSGQPNDGLPTYPYSSPIVDHTGRYVDSVNTASFQNIGFRTARAQLIRVAKESRGLTTKNVPPRMYVQIGSAIAAYTLDNFFSTKLPAGMVSISNIMSGVGGFGRTPPEKVLRWEQFFYPESTQSGWRVPFQDGQDRLSDFDFDDRGYVYAACFGVFGWGIEKDDGKTDGSIMTKVAQLIPGGDAGDAARYPKTFDDKSGVTPKSIVAFKSGSRYYAIVTDKVSSAALWEVPDSGSPRLVNVRSGKAYAMDKWDKDDGAGRFAYIGADGALHVYDYADYVSGAGPRLENTAINKEFVDVAFDDSGALWAAESKNNLWKYTPSGSSYSSTMYTPYGAGRTFEVNVMHAGAGHVVVAGIDRTGAPYYDVLVLKVEATGPRAIDIDNFFKKYYHTAPVGYAEPGSYRGIQADVQMVKSNSKTYLMYSLFGLGDVYELEGSDSISIKVKNDSFGTANPSSKGTAGPYVGDIVTFTAPSSNPAINYDVTWNFGNPEAGTSENQGGPKKGNVEISHQYTGLSTAGQITAAKTVKAVTIQDTAIASQLNLTLKVPTPRIGVSGVTTPLTAAPTGFKVVAGQTFNDASDGSIEGHYSIWTIDGTPTKLAPNQTISVGAVGTHTLSFQGAYGKYDGSFNGTSPYMTTPIAFSYTVLPFKAVLKTPTSSGTNVTFSATPSVTTDVSVITAATWTITWTFTPGGTSASAPITQTGPSPIGTIPNFDVPKAQVTTGSTVSVQAVVDPLGLAPAAQQYSTATDTMTLSTPDPAVTITGCANAASPCTFTASSVSGASMADWTFAWTLLLNGSAVKSGTGNPYQPSITAPGSYTISLKVTKSIFDTTVDKALTVAGNLCSPLPASTAVAINKQGCLSGCTAGTTVTFFPSFQGYSTQACDSYAWSFGSGEGTGTGIEVQHTYNTPGTFTVSLTITNPNGNLTKTTTVVIGNGGGNDSCTAPTTASITYGGTGGCTTGGICRTTESITFTARRGISSSLQTCDNVNWTFSDNTTSTSRNPVKTWSTPGTYTASVVISNTKGTSQTGTVTITVQPPAQGNCSTPPGPGNFAIVYSGATSGCTNINGQDCDRTEIISFNADNFYYTPGTCDNYEWDFGDGSTKATTRAAIHAYTTSGSFPVKLKVSNSAGNWTYSKTVKVQGTVANKPLPVLAATTFPGNGTKNKSVTFTATSNIATTTGWTWNFGDGSASDTSQAGETKQSSTITHTFTKTGTFTVKATARNSEDLATAPVGSVQANITVADAPLIPEYRYLLPVTIHAKGQFNSSWRTDVQIYNPDPNVSVTQPLKATASFKGSEYNLELTKSTVIYEDFLGRLLDHDDQGPVIITTKTATTPPQIWTRTYNQTESGGTFGQFIPAIRLDTAGTGGSVDSGTYFLAGLRHDDRYRTNIGYLNPNATAVTATITVYDERRLKLGEFTETLQPFQLVQYPLKSKETDTFKLPATAPFSVKIAIPAGSNWLIAYASYIDGVSNDPVFMQAIRESDVASADFKTAIVPGVGHTGPWRSDLTIFNPDVDAARFDLTYFNSAGEKKGEALDVVLDSGRFLQYGDLLKQGVLGNVEDGFGLLKISVKSQHEKYPMTFSRTYFDDVANGTYGQGIGAFAAARANVKPNKPALIAGVRNTASYYTNIGLVNVSSVPVVAKITLLDPITGAPAGSIDYPLAPNQSILGSFNGFGVIETGTLKIEANGDVWAFASVIDRRTKDPEYVPATPLQ